MNKNINLEFQEQIKGSYKDYDIIGFDVDYCLSRYNVPEIFKITWNCVMKTFKERNGQFKEMDLTLDEDLLGFGLDYTVLDKLYQNILYLGGDERKVIKGFRGFQQLSEKQLIDFYGENLLIEDFVRQNDFSRFNVFTSYFDSFKAVMYSKIIQFLDEKSNSSQEGKINTLSLEQAENLYQELINSVTLHYSHWNGEDYFTPKTYGGFFPELNKKLDKIVEVEIEFKKVLQKLNQERKFVFLITNSHYEFAKMTLEVVFGQNWEDLFQIKIYNARKPGFFNESSTQPLYLLDKSKPFLKNTIQKIDHLSDHDSFLQGNINHVMQFFREKEIIPTNQEPKIIYFGDSYLSDIESIVSKKNWFAAAVNLDLKFQKNNFEEKFIKYQNYWGNNPIALYKEGAIFMNYFQNLLYKQCQLVISQVDSPRMLKEFWLLEQN